MNALIGWSGFVGSTLRRQAVFEREFRSTDIEQLCEQEYDCVVCAGAPGAKWLADRDPDVDRASLTRLTAALAGLRCRRFVLISTVDVFVSPRDVDETSPVDPPTSPYGRHRRELEQWVAATLPGSVIVRLSGLVGPGLRKNALYDLLNRNQLERLDGGATLQFYPMHRLWSDLQLGLASGLPLVHLVAEPLRLDAVAGVFGVSLDAAEPASVHYDVRTVHGELFGVGSGYQVSRAMSMAAIEAYARSEPRSHR
ncbi:MAG: NAD(P)-dependent oxidoreductase [Myxococcales bacterium]|nr:NAD(P)-dependent oxidoreductase [Myxococcales bacterium]